MTFLRAAALAAALAPISIPASGATRVITGPLSLAVSTAKKILVVRIGNTDVRKYTVAVGQRDYPTPLGHYTIRHIAWNPAWHPPDEGWAKGKQPAAPGGADNPMKVVKIFFREPDYYIHGTDATDSLGSRASHGCIRMSQADVFALARYLQDHAGAPRPESWYDRAINGDLEMGVYLPHPIPLVVGK